MSEEPASQSFAALLRFYRRATGLTQEQLAERAGISARGVSDLERDDQRVPRRDTLDLLARALDLGPADRAALERAIHHTRARGQRGAPAAAPDASLPTGMLSVLIADVRGYATFTNQHGDAAGARLALRFTGLAEEVIAAAGGRVVEVRGDEVLGVFTSAHSALRAATGLVARCAEEATPDLPLRAGVGLDAGEPIAVPGGYRGEVINTAARLCAQAGPGEVLASEVVVALARRVEGLRYQDRGALALKGLGRPVQTWLVCAGDQGDEQISVTTDRIAATRAAVVEPLPVEDQQQSSVAPPTNLPAQATAFVGREMEMSSLTALLSGRHNRLITIVAPGGMGKTRLALEAAGQMQRAFPHGIYFIALDRISAPDLIVQAVTEVLPISLSSREDPQSRISGFLQDKATLLVMDNFEHVLDGAVFVQNLLESAPRVQILATSRTRLNLMSETLFHIEGLPIDAISPDRNSALQLFAQSARRTQPDFDLHDTVAPAVARICRMVDGMPLAIVLAAAWIDTLSADEIAAEIEQGIDILETELRDVSDRQRSVRAVIDWSWNQVDASAQDLLKRLAVFRGGFTRAAAQKAAGASLRGLSHLVDKALVRRDPMTGRYSMHELLRQYAEEHLVLAADLEESAHAAHATYFADFMTTCRMQVRDQRLQTALLAIEADIDNIRAAWDYWTGKQDALALLAFVEAMWMFFEVRGAFTPAIQFFGAAARKLTADDPTIVCARAELRARQAWFTALIGLPEEGLLLARESAATLGRYNNGDVAVNVLDCVSINAIFLNRTEIVRQVVREMLGRAERSGDAWERGWALVWSAYERLLARHAGDAMQAGQEALAIFERLDNPFGVSVAAGLILGLISMTTGDVGAAKAYFSRGVRAAEAINYLRLLQITHDSLGAVALLEGDPARARQFFLKSLRISQECGQTREMLASLRDLATVLIAQGELESALQLLAVVLHHPASDQNSLNRPERLRDEAEKLRLAIETRLDQPHYEAAWETGQRRPLALVVSQVLA